MTVYKNNPYGFSANEPMKDHLTLRTTLLTELTRVLDPATQKEKETLWRKTGRITYDKYRYLLALCYNNERDQLEGALTVI
jgi:hypothetical protein